MWFHADNVVLTALQALCVALPAAGLPAWLARYRRGSWALVLPACIVVCVAGISLAPVSADAYAWAALLLVPPGCALALGWAMRGARPPLALLAPPLLALTWLDGVPGEIATDALIVGSCVTLGRLIAAAAPLPLVKAGLVAMAAIDAVLVFSGALTEPAATLNAAQVAPGLPQLQTGVLHFSSLGYGDFLAAGVLGGVLAAEGAPGGRWALAVLAVSIAWDQLFLVTDLLPATVPPALVLIAREGKNRPMLRRLAPLSLLLTLLLASTALASAGGGSSSFGGGGGGGFSGGGGGSFSGGSSSGGGSASLGTGGTLAVFAIIGLIFLVVFLAGLLSAAKLRRRRRQRVERVTTASAEAAADDEAFAADAVTQKAAELFMEVQTAWDARDRDKLRALVGSDLMVEWERRLDDFESKGWHNRVHVNGRPGVEYVGLVNRADDADDRVVVRIEADTDDYVETRDGGRIMHDGQTTATTKIQEYWTLDKREGRWCLLSIEQDTEGVHNLDAEIVASPWGDSRVHDEAVAERAAAEAAPPGVSPAELVDVDFSGPARAKAMDLSLADGRFDVDLIETSVRRAVAAWAEAVDGADTDLEAVARPEAVRALLGDADAKTRVVIRGPKVDGVTITDVNAETTPATLTVSLAVRARRYVEDRDTVALISGSRDDESSFAERWTLALDGQGEWPWRIAATAASTPA
jgi:predicted lipid-binding transport protein (Tim44 family)/uncharacterized membrane protein YgcG